MLVELRRSDGKSDNEIEDAVPQNQLPDQGYRCHGELEARSPPQLHQEDPERALAERDPGLMTHRHGVPARPARRGPREKGASQLNPLAVRRRRSA